MRSSHPFLVALLRADRALVDATHAHARRNTPESWDALLVAITDADNARSAWHREGCPGLPGEQIPGDSEWCELVERNAGPMVSLDSVWP